MGMNGGHVLVLGNEKGGTGKSTTAMHLIVALLKLDRRVGAIDLDSRQQSLSRYIENRLLWCERNAVALPLPLSRTVPRSRLDSRAAEKPVRPPHQTSPPAAQVS